MTEPEVTAKDRERYARARAPGEARLHDASAVVEAHYDPDGDVIDLKCGGGGSMAIPRTAVPGLQRASGSKLASVVVSPAGDALSWPSLDVDAYVPSLVERTFGSRLFAAAGKANGGKGGRSRKRPPHRSPPVRGETRS